MADKRAIAVMINMLVCILFTSYVLLIRPFKNNEMNNLQIFNESCIMLANYHMLLFTDYISDIYMKFDIGWSLIAVTLFMILANLILMFKGHIRAFFASVRKIKDYLKSLSDPYYKQRSAEVKYFDRNGNFIRDDITINTTS